MDNRVCGYLGDLWVSGRICGYQEGSLQVSRRGLVGLWVSGLESIRGKACGYQGLSIRGGDLWVPGTVIIRGEDLWVSGTVIIRGEDLWVSGTLGYQVLLV